MVERKETEKIWVTTKEGWVYEITENKVELLGQRGKNPPPNLETADITFILDPEGYTNQNVTVEIQLNKEIEGFTLQYSRDANKWDNYKEGEKILYTENGTIHARLINALEEFGGTASQPIDKIDKKAPKAVIALNPSTVETGNPITATVTQSDEGGSGVNITKCKWGYTTTDTKTLGENPNSYTGGYFKAGQTEIKLNITTPGTYYLHILTVDNAGNPKETISNVITIKKPPTVEDLKNGDIVNYVAKNGSTIKCKVLWDANSTYGQNGVQIISMGSIETVSIGSSTTYWSGSANTMNNSIATLNSKASTYMNSTFSNSARCVGSKPDNPSYENTARWPTGYTGDTVLRGVDENYTADGNQLIQLGIDKIGTGYWLASRGESVSGNQRSIGVRWYDGSSLKVNTGGFSTTGSNMMMSNGTMWSGPTHGFRPVFTLRPEIKIVDNEGSYTLSV